MTWARLAAVLLTLALLSFVVVGTQAQVPDRPSGAGTTTTLNTLNQIVAQPLGGYHSASVTFSSSSLSGATVKPVCSFGDPLNTASYVESGDFKLSDTSDEDVVAASITANFDRTYTISCGASSPTGIGVKLTAIGSGAVSTIVRVKQVHPWFHFWPELVDKALSSLKVRVSNMVQIAGQDGAAAISTFSVCTGSFNELLDANEIRALTTLPSGGQIARICRMEVIMDGNATGAANFELIEGTTSSTACDTSAASVKGPWTLEPTKVPGFYLGSVNAPVRALTAARILCAKSTNATSTNKIIVTGMYTIY